LSSATSAAASRIKPAQSKRVSVALLLRAGRKRQPISKPATQNGSGSRKIERHPNSCNSTPPMLGPIAGTNTMPKPNMPIALPRRSGGNTSNSAIIDNG
jgi:hypothetical protein